MKKVFCFISVLLVSVSLFAKTAKTWKASDMFYQSKMEKIIESYNLTKVYTDDIVDLYKNEETSDWLYVYRYGREDRKDNFIFHVTFGYLGGIYDSFTKYGSYIKREGTFKYIYACITEDSVMIPETDYQPNSHWVWSNPSGIYAYMFRNRNSTFSYLEEKKEKYELFIPQEVSEKYSYFKEWLAANSQSKDLEISIPKEYKKYLKEHK